MSLEILNRIIDDLIFNVVPTENRTKQVDVGCRWIQYVLVNGLGANSFITGAGYSNVAIPTELIEITQLLPRKQTSNWHMVAGNAMNLEAGKVKEQSIVDLIVTSVTMQPHQNNVLTTVNYLKFMVSPNNLTSLMLCAVLEELDEKVIGCNHLLKRSLILIKTWCYIESKKRSIYDLSAALPHDALVIMTIRLFVKRSTSKAPIEHPLDALVYFLEDFSRLDWKRNAISCTDVIGMESGIIIPDSPNGAVGHNPIKQEVQRIIANCQLQSREILEESDPSFNSSNPRVHPPFFPSRRMDEGSSRSDSPVGDTSRYANPQEVSSRYYLQSNDGMYLNNPWENSSMNFPNQSGKMNKIQTNSDSDLNFSFAKQTSRPMNMMNSSHSNSFKHSDNEHASQARVVDMFRKKIPFKVLNPFQSLRDPVTQYISCPQIDDEYNPKLMDEQINLLKVGFRESALFVRKLAEDLNYGELVSPDSRSFEERAKSMAEIVNDFFQLTMQVLSVKTNPRNEDLTLVQTPSTSSLSIDSNQQRLLRKVYLPQSIPMILYQSSTGQDQSSSMSTISRFNDDIAESNMEQMEFVHIGNYFLPASSLNNADGSMENNSDLLSRSNSESSGFMRAIPPSCYGYVQPPNRVTFSHLSSSSSLLITYLKHAEIVLSTQMQTSTLLNLTLQVLNQLGPTPIGEIGKQLQYITGNPNLLRELKKTFFGLKRLLALYPSIFHIGDDHNFNPKVYIVGKHV